MSGVLAVVVCAYLAAVYLTADARRTGDVALVYQFRSRALGAGVVAGAIAASGLVWLHLDANSLYQGLLHRGLSLVVVSALAGAAALGFIYRRSFVLSRVAAAIAVTAVLWAWAVAQYPKLLQPNLTVAGAAANHSVLVAMLVCLGAGAVLLVPSLAWLYSVAESGDPGYLGSKGPVVNRSTFGEGPLDPDHHQVLSGHGAKPRRRIRTSSDAGCHER
jgi:cytochrome d ubiquinol oxidase subunit II